MSENSTDLGDHSLFSISRTRVPRARFPIPCFKGSSFACLIRRRNGENNIVVAGVPFLSTLIAH